MTFRGTARRLPVALAALGLTAVWAPADAVAQPPEPIEITYMFPDPEVGFPQLCSFPVAIEIEGKTKTIELPGGVTIITAPGQTATVTNATTGTSAVLKISGTSKILATGEVVFRGANLIIRSPAFGDDTTALVFATGRFTFDPTATPRLSGDGRMTDICAALH